MFKKSSKRSSTSQAALVTDIADTGITAATGADITAATARLRQKKTLRPLWRQSSLQTPELQQQLIQKVLVPLLGQGFFM